MKVNKHPPRADFHERNDCGPPGGAKVWRAVLMPATMALLLVVSAQGGQKSTTPRDLTELSLEDLLSIEVTSVARKEQKLSHTAAAVYVVTQEDIRRSGATSIPEAIRMVPGLQVAQLDANKWAISSRGFNDRFANKLLVLLDGRTIYTPLFSGVHWDMHDVLIEDIERIEVIRGPGAVMWGSNAVNGVISIITKRAEDTQGSLVTSGAGNQESAFGSLRSGGKLEIVPNLVEGGRAAVLKPGSLRESSKPFTTKENRREETISHSGFREATASQPQRPHPPAQPKLPTHAALG